MEWEVKVIRKLFFLETVEGFDDVSGNLLDFLNTNSEMVETRYFSDWLEDNEAIEELRDWLEKRGIEYYFNEVYKPLK